MWYGQLRLYRSRRLENINRVLSFHRTLLTIAIETSCDDTSVAVLEKASGSADRRLPGPLAKLHFHERITADNTGRRGIDPIRALASHTASLGPLLERSLHSLPGSASYHEPSTERRHLTLRNGTRKLMPDFVTVTRGPGVRSSLTCGLEAAKGLSAAWQIPLLAVHHMQAHALTPRLDHALSSDNTATPSSGLKPEFPFLSLLVSGGHTLLLNSRGLLVHETLAESADIAIGEALDKVGRLVLPSAIQSSLSDIAYAKHLSTYAFPTEASQRNWYEPPASRADECSSQSNEYGWEITTPLTNSRALRFSFSGIASQIERLFNLRSIEPSFTDGERLAFARAALTTAFNHLASRIVIALDQLQGQYRKQLGSYVINADALSHESPVSVDAPRPLPKTLVVSGGVAANPFLRHVLRRFLDVRGFSDIELIFPSIELCTDNAAMIGWIGMEMWEAGWRSDLSVNAIRRWSMHPTNGNTDGTRGEMAEELRAKAEAKAWDRTDDSDSGSGEGILGVKGWYSARGSRDS